MMDPSELPGVERMREEMVEAREAMAASARRIIAALMTHPDLDAGPSSAELAEHLDICRAEANATAVYLQCLLAIASRTLAHADQISRPARLG